MPTNRSHAALLLAVLTAVALTLPGTAVAQPTQPSYDVLRLAEDGTVLPYKIWVEWTPLVITTPDNGAWAFFSAQAKRANDALGSRRLYAARFDPNLGAWLPATALPGGEIQFGPAAVVDSKGVVHVVYSDRRNSDKGVYSTLSYTRADGQGGWVAPTPVAADPNAGHQMMPSLVADPSDRLYLIWRDQRSVAADAREAVSANADIFASDYVDGAWSAPTQVNQRPAPDVNAAWPHLAMDGDRLVAVWSVYQGTQEEQVVAARVEWSSRPLADQKRWAAPTSLIEREDSATGGRLVDVAANPAGGAVLIYGRTKGETNALFLRRLDPGAAAWGADVALAAGDLGYLPNLTVGADGTAYVVFTHGHGSTAVDVGAQVLPPGSDTPGAEVVLTQGEEGLQARASVNIGADGKPWIVYMHQPPNGDANEIRSLRGARLSA